VNGAQVSNAVNVLFGTLGPPTPDLKRTCMLPAAAGIFSSPLLEGRVGAIQESVNTGLGISRVSLQW